MTTLKRRMLRHAATAVLASLLLATVAHAGPTAEPYSWTHPTTLAATQVPVLALPPINPQQLLAEDSARATTAGAYGHDANKKMRVAVENNVQVSPIRDGAWETEADGSRLWRLTVTSGNSTDLRFGFQRFMVEEGVTLHLVNEADRLYSGPFTRDNTSPDGQLWLAPIAGAEITLELRVPAGVALPGDGIALTSVSSGYRNATGHGGPTLFGAGVSGVCNIDVVCPLGDEYRDEIRAVAKFYFQEPGGTYLCTGSLVNNTAQDLTPYFLTANHCVSTQASATSMSLIWNYESPTCGAHGNGSTADTQNGGATLVAHRSDVDFSLVKLNSTPPEDFNVYYAGWDATGVIPGGSIGIHHPSGWVKAITETDHPLTTMNSCIGPGSQTHWRTGAPYSQGTTEGGSSGSAIVVPADDASGHDRLIIGMLSGGTAYCAGSVPNSGYDCYGKFSVAWEGSAASSRLKDWLDPDATGATTQEGIDPSGPPAAPVIGVDPTALSGSAETGQSTTAMFSIGNSGDATLDFTIDTAISGDCDSPSKVPWLSATPTSSSVEQGDPAVEITATLDATSLAVGSYTADLCVHSNDATQPVIAVPVEFTVTVSDLIFADGFDGDDAPTRSNR